MQPCNGRVPGRKNPQQEDTAMKGKRRLGVNVGGERKRALQVMMTPEEGQRLDTCQALINATNPAEGPMSKVDVVTLAVNLLYRRLRGQAAAVRKVVKEIDPDAPKRSGRRKEGGQAHGTASAEAEPMCDLDEIQRGLDEHKANERKASASVR